MPQKIWGKSDNFKRCHGGNIFLVITIITSFSQNAWILMFDSSKNPQKNTDYRKNNAGAVRQNCGCQPRITAIVTAVIKAVIWGQHSQFLSHNNNQNIFGTTHKCSDQKTPKNDLFIIWDVQSNFKFLNQNSLKEGKRRKRRKRRKSKKLRRKRKERRNFGLKI